MNHRASVTIAAILFSALILWACAAGQKEYDVGMQLSQAGKEREAIAYLEQALANDPNNEKYQEALVDLKAKLVEKYIQQGSQALASDPLTISAFNEAKQSLNKAQEIDAANPSVVSFSNTLSQKEQAFHAEVKTLYSNAKDAAAKEDWIKAYFLFQQVQSRFPNYEDSTQLLTEVTNKGSQAYYLKAKAYFDADDFMGAKTNVNKALSLKSDHQPSRELLALVRERDNKEYFIKKAQAKVQARQWDEAIQAYQMALKYSPDDQLLISLTNQVKSNAVDYYVQKSRAEMEYGKLFQAFDSYQLAASYYDDDPPYSLQRLRDDLTTRLGSLAEQYIAEGHSGSAWFCYQKIKHLDPNYPDIFYLTRRMEDQISQRVKKSIAVFDFTSPVDSTDAGVIVANKLITYLFKTASGDIKILERENLKSILEEMKLGQIGVVSSDTAKEMGRVYGIDVAIMGSVLLYKVDSSSSEGTQTVRYQIGTKIEDNIAYLNWLAKHPDPSREELAKAPPAKTTIPQYEEKDYIVSKHRKIGFVQIAFRIVDVATGENIQVKTIERKKIVEDVGSAGVPEAEIKYDPVEIPSNTELLQVMTEEVVAELGLEALRPLQNLEKTYFEAGEKHLRRRENIISAEYFVNAIFDEKMKMIQGSPITKQSMQNLEDIFLNYKFVYQEE